MNGRILNVPYKSQNDADATLKRSDCAPACIAMILGALGKAVTTNAVTLASGMSGDSGLQLEQLSAAAKAFGLELSIDMGATLDRLKSLIDKGCPTIVLVKYGKLPDRWDQSYVGGHFVVVVGYDDTQGRIYLNDPDYPPGALGYQWPCAYRVFLNAWGGFDAQEQLPNFSLIIPQLSVPVPGATPSTSTALPQPATDAWVAVPAGLTLWSQPTMSALVVSDLTFGQHLMVLSAQQAWRQVSTDSGLVGWITDSVDKYRSLSDAQPAIPFPVEVVDATPTREADGISMRSQCGINILPLDRVQIGERLTVYDSYTDEDGTTWLGAQSPRQHIGWIRDRTGDTILVRKVSLEKGLAVDVSTPIPSVSPILPPKSEPPATVVAWVIAPIGLVLRAEPSSSAQRLGSLPFGKRLNAIGDELPSNSSGQAWQEVRTDNGQSGFVLASQGSERYLSFHQPPAPYMIKVLDTILMRRTAGLIVYESRSTSSAQVDKVLADDRLIVYGSVTENNDGTWLWVRSPRGQYGWLREKQGNVTLVERLTQDTLLPTSPVGDIRPFGKCLSGLGMGNPQPLTPLELAVIIESKVEAVKILTPPDPGDTSRLIAGLKRIAAIKLIVARLYFPVDANSQTRFSPQVFVNTVFQGANAAYQAGVRYFEIHNEPNLAVEGMDWNWKDGAEFSTWLIQTAVLLRQHFPGSKLGFPGLSPQPNVASFLSGASAAINQCDWIGIHCYWQSADQGPYPMTAANAGMYWRQFRDLYPNKLLMITEFSNNLANVSPLEKGRQYARYYQLLRDEMNVGAAFAFALSWPGQDQNGEGWMSNGKATGIATAVGSLIGQPGYLA